LTRRELRRQVAAAAEACQAKKADDLTVLQMGRDGGDSFTDYFVICSGANPRQVQAICDGVEEALSAAGQHPTHIEGYRQADWVLLDYVDFVVHIFQEKARKFYDLERLWRSAKRLTPAELRAAPAARKAKARKPAARPAARKAAKRGGGKRKAAGARSRRGRRA
jgi:ribosome-associated protein